jgi:hypothetical protein
MKNTRSILEQKLFFDLIVPGSSPDFGWFLVLFSKWHENCIYFDKALISHRIKRAPANQP